MVPIPQTLPLNCTPTFSGVQLRGLFSKTGFLNADSPRHTEGRISRQVHPCQKPVKSPPHPEILQHQVGLEKTLKRVSFKPVLAIIRLDTDSTRVSFWAHVERISMAICHFP